MTSNLIKINGELMDVIKLLELLFFHEQNTRLKALIDFDFQAFSFYCCLKLCWEKIVRISYLFWLMIWLELDN